jgi:hypothetical protein
VAPWIGAEMLQTTSGPEGPELRVAPVRLTDAVPVVNSIGLTTEAKSRNPSFPGGKLIDCLIFAGLYRLSPTVFKAFGGFEAGNR